MATPDTGMVKPWPLRHNDPAAGEEINKGEEARNGSAFILLLLFFTQEQDEKVPMCVCMCVMICACVCSIPMCLQARPTGVSGQ